MSSHLAVLSYLRICSGERGVVLFTNQGIDHALARGSECAQEAMVGTVHRLFELWKKRDLKIFIVSVILFTSETRRCCACGKSSPRFTRAPMSSH